MYSRQVIDVHVSISARSNLEGVGAQMASLPTHPTLIIASLDADPSITSVDLRTIITGMCTHHRLRRV